MEYQKKPVCEFTLAELDRELIIRGARNPEGNPFQFTEQGGILERKAIMSQVKQMYEAARSLTPNKELSHLETRELVELVICKTKDDAPKEVRGRWDEDNRMDICMVEDPEIREKAGSVAAICDALSLIDAGDGTSILETRKYGKHFNLNENEPFRNQPIAVGLLGTGFLVKEDIIATACHCVNKNNLAQLRFVFGFKMMDSQFAATQVPNVKIYKGVEIIGCVYKRQGNKSDWALVKLDRKAIGQPVVKLSDREIKPDEPVYVIGHPLGLPLKYSPGAQVRSTSETYFSADLDVYSRNSGSPVFNGNTHEVAGIVVRGDTQDFRWTGKDWISVIYPNPDFRSREPQCTKAREFMKYCQQTGN